MVLCDASVGDLTFRPNSALIDFYIRACSAELHTRTHTCLRSRAPIYGHPRIPVFASPLRGRFFYSGRSRESPRIKPCRNRGSRLDSTLFFCGQSGGWDRGEPSMIKRNDASAALFFFARNDARTCRCWVEQNRPVVGVYLDIVSLESIYRVCSGRKSLSSGWRIILEDRFVPLNLRYRSRIEWVIAIIRVRQILTKLCTCNCCGIFRTFWTMWFFGVGSIFCDVNPKNRFSVINKLSV